MHCVNLLNQLYKYVINRVDIILFDLDNTTIKEYIRQAEFGIERENLRVNSDGTLAQTPHPFTEHKNIDRDFCENQVEIISDVFDGPQRLYDQLIELQNVYHALNKESGDIFSYDCSYNNMEFSFGKESELHTIHGRFVRYYISSEVSARRYILHRCMSVLKNARIPHGQCLKD